MNPTNTPAKVFIALAGTMLVLVAANSVLDAMTPEATRKVRRRGRTLRW